MRTGGPIMGQWPMKTRSKIQIYVAKKGKIFKKCKLNFIKLSNIRRKSRKNRVKTRRKMKFWPMTEVQRAHVWCRVEKIDLYRFLIVSIIFSILDKYQCCRRSHESESNWKKNVELNWIPVTWFCKKNWKIPLHILRSCFQYSLNLELCDILTKTQVYEMFQSKAR